MIFLFLASMYHNQRFEEMTTNGCLNLTKMDKTILKDRVIRRNYSGSDLLSAERRATFKPQR